MLVVAVVVGHVSGESFVITRCVRASSAQAAVKQMERRRAAAAPQGGPDSMTTAMNPEISKRMTVSNYL